MRNLTLPYDVIIPAGGIGLRMNLSVAKQFVMIGAYPLIYFTIRKFYEINLVRHIIIPVTESSITLMEDWVDQWQFQDKISIVKGGQTRQDSVWSAIESIPPGDSYVMIHDAVRPYISIALIERLMEVVQDKQAVIPVIPVKDTIKFIRDQQVESTPPRELLYAVQTPQVFRLKLVRQAMRYIRENRITVTDDAMALEMAGYPVYSVPGEEINHKITTPADLELLKESYLV